MVRKREINKSLQLTIQRKNITTFRHIIRLVKFNYCLLINHWFNNLLAFINNLLEFYSKRTIKSNSEVLLIMDNCPYQTSGSTKDKLREWKVNILYLPPYWPELAPVELMFRSLNQNWSPLDEKRVFAIYPKKESTLFQIL